MIVYIIPLIYCLICILLFDCHRKTQGRGVFYNILLIYLILLAGFSYRVGSDSGGYMEGFKDIPDIFELSTNSFEILSYQPFYLIFCSLCKTVVSDIWFMHLCQSWVVCLVIFHFIRKRTQYIFTGALLFMTCIYTYFCYEIYKESLAVSMLLLGYPYLEKKKYTKYYIFAFFALMFHYSGVVAFFIPFVQKIRFNKKFFVWFFVVILVMELLSIYAPRVFFNETVFEKYQYYLYVATDRYNQNWFIDSFLRNVCVPLIAGVWLKHNYERLSYEWSYCVYVLLGVGTLEYALIFERPINYVLPFVVLSLTELAGQSYYKKNLIGKVGTFVVCLVFWLACRGLFYSRYEAWRLMIPYESIFTGKIDNERENVVKEIH